MAINIESTAATLNRYAVQYGADIQQKLRQGLEWEQMFPVRACDNTYSAPNATVSEILQAYQSDFTPKGNTTFDAVENKLQKIKVDMQLDGDDLEKFWDSWKVEWHEIGLDPMEFSFPRYMYEKLIFPKLTEELNTNAWKGVYAAPTPGTAGDSINAVNGYKTNFEAAITAGNVTEYATGVLVEGTMVDQIESWCDALPDPYRNLPGRIYMSKSRSNWYFRNYRENFGAGAGTDNNMNSELRIDNTGKRIMGINSMEGSDRIFFVPDAVENVIWGTRRGFPTFPEIRFQYIDRKIKLLGEFYRFYGVEFWDHLMVNDQE
jgi:hypothetical protein